MSVSSSKRIDGPAVTLPASTAAPLITVTDVSPRAVSPGAVLPRAVSPRAATVPAASVPEQVPAESARRVSSRQWYPPRRVWQVYLLFLLTFGIYGVVWSYRFAHDFRRHRKRRARPRLHWVALVASLGLAAPYVVYRQARWIRRLNREIEHQTWPEPEVIAGLCGASLAAGVGVIAASQLGLIDGAGSLALGGLVYLLLPLPWAVMQRQLNIFKDTRPAGPWADPPYKLRLSHYATMVVGAMMIASAGYTLFQDLAPRSLGDTVVPGQPVKGASGLYVLVPTADFWVRTDAGMLEEAADLELVGPTLDTQVVVTVFQGDDWTLDRITRQRLARIRSAQTLLEKSEARTLTPGRLDPRSDARYLVERNGLRLVYHVVTIVTPERAFEVVSFTPESSGHASEIEAVVTSFALF